ncbi:TPA: hypothetical protein DEP30_02300 [Candidatus Nomurabacteria bacterium]|nr:MAG: hypothetical protein UR97_C0003G0032 [Candidatus Nomurabacteria bacterium GW2011_GWE2_36_115]KKP94100.1 MAG: hypothetical protein US00_C0003G0024 [Candidatus Nomurabacteria bacterium GW2011_GWF2_36_126]KKP96772.1 MAG: hypothetical protein US04_C0001G0274 [Candidatus Nomurabacteria bacterium GW2011_GWD2_36_14]KKP99624.1 MAG: hypothetical protein US08_C0001G0307 [Candidatus Nomurabacteria bacterium GW2011_GWF2_36_19]KKQ05460.1 MAG: hypothetical protein US17_C0004G0032 [Candidatus Nomuraba
MEEYIINTPKLTKEDCDKMLQVVNLIENYQKGFPGFSSNTRIPLYSLNAYGVTMQDLNNLSKVLEKLILIDKQQYFSEENIGDDLLIRRIAPSIAKEKIELLKNQIEDNPITLQKYTKKDNKQKVCIDLRGLIFLKEDSKNSIKVSDKKLEILKLLSKGSPKTMSKLTEEAGYSEERSVSTAIKNINKSFEDKFEQENNLIIPAGSGYCFNKYIFSISIIK